MYFHIEICCKSFLKIVGLSLKGLKLAVTQLKFWLVFQTQGRVGQIKKVQILEKIKDILKTFF